MLRVKEDRIRRQTAPISSFVRENRILEHKNSLSVDCIIDTRNSMDNYADNKQLGAGRLPFNGQTDITNVFHKITRRKHFDNTNKIAVRDC